MKSISNFVQISHANKNVSTIIYQKTQTESHQSNMPVFFCFQRTRVTTSTEYSAVTHINVYGEKPKTNILYPDASLTSIKNNT